MLTSADITRLVAAGGTKRRAGNGSTAKNRWFDGTTWYGGKPPLSTNMHFEGRVGTKRRSRKGLVRTMPNGSRYIVGQYDTPQVLAYKVTQ